LFCFAASRLSPAPLRQLMLPLPSPPRHAATPFRRHRRFASTLSRLHFTPFI
jgi:hypothetical protein